MAVDLLAIGTNYATYVFGNELLASLGFLFIIFMIGIAYDMKLEGFTVVIAPTLLLLLDAFLMPTGIPIILLIGIGLFIGLALTALILRR